LLSLLKPFYITLRTLLTRPVEEEDIVAGDLISFQRYMGNKVAQWRQDSALQGFQSLSEYLTKRGAPSLADEFRQDDQFWSERICEFVSSTRGEELTGVISTVSGFWDADLGIAASVVIGGIQLACASRRTEGLAAPLAIVGGLLLVVVLSLLATNG